MCSHEELTKFLGNNPQRTICVAIQTNGRPPRMEEYRVGDVLGWLDPAVLPAGNVRLEDEPPPERHNGMQVIIPLGVCKPWPVFQRKMNRFLHRMAVRLQSNWKRLILA